MAVVVESKVQCLCAIFIMGNSVVDEMKFVCPVFYHCQCYQVQIVTTESGGARCFVWQPGLYVFP